MCVPCIGHNLNQSSCLPWFTGCVIIEPLIRYNNSHKNLFSLIIPSRKIKQKLDLKHFYSLPFPFCNKQFCRMGVGYQMDSHYTHSQRRVQNPGKHLRWRILRKKLTDSKSLTIFAKRSILDV